jgi:hypothetical protein
MAAVIAAIWLHGAYYGPPAQRLAVIDANDRARNDALAYQAEQEERNGEVVDARYSQADQAFKEMLPGIGVCLQTEAQASALNVIEE